MMFFLISDLSVRGGTHKQFLKLIEYIDKHGIEFKIITHNIDLDNTYPGFLKFEKDIIVIKEFERNSIIGKFINYFKNYRVLKAAVSNGNIINIHDGGFEKYLGAFKGKKVYWQINDLNACFQEGVFINRKNTFFNKLLKIYIKSNINVITKFTVNVSKNADRIKKHFNRHALVFYCGIEPIGFKKDQSKTMKRFKNKQINLLSSGVFFPYRNYETQIKVVKILKNNGIDVSLNIFGSTLFDPVYSEKIKKIIEDEDLSNSIKVLGQIDDEMFRDLHNNSDLFLFINLDQSWGLAVFEAMSCGLPVIVSENVGATEILHNGKNSVFVNPKNDVEIAKKIMDIINDENYYHELSNLSLKFHENYSWDHSYCSKMLSLLNENQITS